MDGESPYKRMSGGSPASATGRPAAAGEIAYCSTVCSMTAKHDEI